MPYNPGVQDMSGQILAQGISQFAQGVGGGIAAAGKRYDENKVLSGQVKALETLLPLYAQHTGATPEEIEKFLAPSPDESPRQRAARLSQAVEGIIGVSALKSRGLNDELVRTNTAGAQQAQQIAAANRRDQVAQRGRVRAIYGGQPARDEIEAMLQTGSRFEDLGAQGGPPPGVEQMLAAGVDDPQLLATIERVSRLKEPEPGLVFQEDPTTGHRFAIGSKGQFANSGINPKKAPTTKPAGVVEVQVGPARYFYHVESKRYFDEQGKPVVFPSGGDAAILQALGSEPGGAGAPRSSKPEAAGTAFKSAEEVRAAVKAGTLSREAGLKILQQQFSYK